MIDLTPYFTVLGLPPDATLEQVEEAHRDLIAGMHPDVQPEPRKKRFEDKVKKYNDARDMIRKHYQEWRASRNDRSASGTSGAGAGGATKDDAAAKAEEARRKAEEARKRAEAEKEKKTKESETQEEARRQEQEEFRKLHEAYLAAQVQVESVVADKRELIANTAAISVLAVVVLSGVAFASNLITQGRIALLKHDADAWTVRGRDDRLTSRYDRYRQEAKAELQNLLGREPTSEELESYRPPFKPPTGSVYTSPWEQPPPLNPDGSNRLTLPHWQEMERRREEDRRRQQEQQAQQQQTYQQNRIATLKSDILGYQQQLDGLGKQLASIDQDISVESGKVQENEARMAAVEQQLGANFMYNAADRRWHPTEFSQWQVFQQLAETARRRISVLQAQRSNQQADSQNLQSKIDKAKQELTQLQGSAPSEQVSPIQAPSTTPSQPGVPMEEIPRQSTYGQRLKKILDGK